MIKKYNVGIFLHFGYDLQGLLYNENKSYNDLFSHPNIGKIYVFDYKGKYSEICKDFEFDYTRVIVSGYSDVEKFRKIDYLFLWDGYMDFFAGMISTKATDVYSMISKITNDFGIKAFFRICDSHHFMKDYKQMIADRLSNTNSGEKFKERNIKLYNILDDVKSINYENVFFLCNGSRSVRDWSWVTLTHSMPFLTKEFVQSHSIYLSDDILFRYSEEFEKFSELKIDNKIQTLYHVGNLNPGKVKQIKKLMKTSKLTLNLRTPNKSIMDGLKNIPSITLLDSPIYRDEMFKELNKYQAYLFVGKGDEESYYFNKTMYDASIAKTVFLIYSKIDKSNIYHELSEYVFNDTEELQQKFEWLKTQDYQKHLDYQREILVKNLSNESLDIFK